MVYIVFDKKSSGSGVATLVIKIAANGDFRPGYVTIRWRITLNNY